MKTKIKNKSLISTGFAFEEVLFDVGTTKISTQFNGIGGFTYYHLIDDARFRSNGGPSLLTVFINGTPIDVNAKKQVISIGRTQRIIYKLADGKVIIDQFAVEENIYNKISFKFNKEAEFAVSYDFLKFVNMPQVAFDGDYVFDKENIEYYAVRKGSSGTLNACISFTDDPNKYVGKINSLFKKAKDEYLNLEMPEAADSELLKAIYTSSMFTALENYKEKGEFNAFAAGVNYLTPLRTYFRDSYWTTLCLHNYNKQYLSKQIIALAKGIHEDGDCASAVKSDLTCFWGGHLDSPCFFIMMVADYIKNGGDKAILKLDVNGMKVKELAINVIECLMKKADKTGLIYKQGPRNRLDWADAVNRVGYVTYDECLYYQALRCINFILDGKEPKYLKAAKVVKEQINNILWDDKLGYYVNFVDGDLKVDNLSIDTCLAVLFDIVPENKKQILLDNFEKILYSKNHKELSDFGVMCVYPLYKGYDRTHSISSKPFNYHNGGNWPYLSGIFAYMLRINGRDYHYALESWFNFSIKKGCLTPLEFLTPYYKQGSNLQAWSSTSAFALQNIKDNFFQYRIEEGEFIYEK